MKEVEGGMMRGQMHDRIALVTGSAKGIGQGIALEMAKEGASIIIADVDEEASLATQRQIGQMGGTALIVLTDVSDERQHQHLVETSLARFGRIDILVNNVGIGIHNIAQSGLLRLSRQDGLQVFQTNVLEPLFLTQHVAKEMIARQIHGSILFTSSIHSRIPYTDPVYAMTKAAIEMLVRNLAIELAEYDIRVNAVAPGAIATGQQPLSYRLVPLGRRRGTPQEVAQVMTFLASEKAAYITGETIVVDGGYSLAHAEYWSSKGFFQRS